MIRTLLIDNYDSFTFNLFQMIAEVNGVEPVVVKNDQLLWDDIDRASYDNIVVSPGPGSPDKPQDFGICAYAVQRATCPVLGVCLGHQGMAHYHGGKVTHAPYPMHGRLSPVYHDGKGVFANLPNPFKVVRYHSLMVAQLPPEFVRTAWTQDGIMMGHRHATRPLYGVQFHPESICTEGGSQILANFANITAEHLGRPQTYAPKPHGVTKTSVVVPASVPTAADEKPALQVIARELGFFPNPEAAFVTLYGDKQNSFWLDSARHEAGLARFSYMGDACGPRAHVLRYWAAQKKMSVTRGSNVEILNESVLDFLDRELKTNAMPVQSNLPFDFQGGYIGYFGYELLSGHPIDQSLDVPDAMWVNVDRFIAFDHQDKRAWLVSCAPAAESVNENAWMIVTEAALRSLRETAEPAPQPQEIELHLRHRPVAYLAMIERCQQLLKDGESYEMCLVNELSVKCDVEPLAYYRNLRRINPAPYAAFLNFPELSVASSSPELFLGIDQNRRCEAKPIKGTARRSADPEKDRLIKETLENDEKTQAENLMIVDLLRNDLGRVCEVGSVHVPKLMKIESYATVHQMVSTIAGTLRGGCTVGDAMKSTFPGGSMTGAPKIRSMDMLVGLEQGKRGIYSGAIGFLGFNGVTKLNIVIRTAVLRPGLLTVGSGGAIVALSSPQEELEETFIKLEPPLKALALTIGTTLEDIFEKHWEGRPAFSARAAAMTPGADAVRKPA